MANPTEPPNQVYQQFIPEALKLLQQIEDSLLTLPQDLSTARIYTLVQAANTIKSGAAYVGLTGIQTLAQQLESIFLSLRQEGLSMDAELEALLLQAYQCLRLPLLADKPSSQVHIADVLDRAQPIFAKLEARLGKSSQAATTLPTAADLGIDLAKLMLHIDVPEALERWQEILSQPHNPKLIAELRHQAEVLLGVGEVLDLPQFVEIAQVVFLTIAASPQLAPAVGQMALVGWQAASQAALDNYAEGKKNVSPAAAAPINQQHRRPEINSFANSFPAFPSLEEIFSSYPRTTGPSVTGRTGGKNVRGQTGPVLMPRLPSPIPDEKSRRRAGWEALTVNQSLGSTSNVERVLKTEDLLVWSSGSAVLLLPSNRVVEVLAAQSDRIEVYGEQRFLDWEQQKLPIYQISELMEYKSLSPVTANRQNLASAEPKPVMMLVLKLGPELMALEVEIDQLVSESELTVKPFSAAIAAPNYIYGCTNIRGDRPLPVIDVVTLVQQTVISAQSALNNTSTVLVIDDSRTVREILTMTLEEAGYQVVSAKDGREAIDRLQQHPEVQLVICDIEMPVMNGFDFLRYRRQRPQLARVPVVMLTFVKTERDRDLARQLGASAYITKPYLKDEFLALLDKILSRNTEVQKTEARKRDTGGRKQEAGV
ncbi:MAG: response regulator [Cyanosarcina radialis HA8281-LM2]|jgi:chemotaxis family two-component system sensor histidine kinase/response regulator PixL|nr:response regulator [Cyanosarcina radialis HA8281-LM2]